MHGLPDSWVPRALVITVAALFVSAVVPSRAHADCTGPENTCLGIGALDSNGSGTANSAFGYRALEKNVVGAGNTAVGDLALTEGWENTQNTAVGQYAMRKANGTWQNTAIGLLSLAGDGTQMTGSYNVGVGAFSLL